MSKIASGLIIFRNIANQIEYLLLQTSYGEHHFTPPKGHLDDGETYFDAAIRETKEEAGLDLNIDYKIIDNFKIELNYLVNSKPKLVIYLLAKLNNPLKEITLSDEHIDYKWLNLNDAMVYAKHKDMQDALRKTEDFIINNKI